MSMPYYQVHHKCPKCGYNWNGRPSETTCIDCENLALAATLAPDVLAAWDDHTLNQEFLAGASCIKDVLGISLHEAIQLQYWRQRYLDRPGA